LLRRFMPFQYKHAIQSEACSRPGGLTAVVGLHCPSSDQRVCLLCLRIGNQILKLANFVASEGMAGQIISLDPQFWPTKILGYALEPLDRGGEVCEMDLWLSYPSSPPAPPAVDLEYASPKVLWA